VGWSWRSVDRIYTLGARGIIAVTVARSSVNGRRVAKPCRGTTYLDQEQRRAQPLFLWQGEGLGRGNDHCHGAMLMLPRKKLVGSYFALTTRNRS
jgi:hypothetical protein